MGPLSVTCGVLVMLCTYVPRVGSTLSYAACVLLSLVCLHTIVSMLKRDVTIHNRKKGDQQGQGYNSLQDTADVSESMK